MVKILALRRFAFRDVSDKIVYSHNGNFLVSKELKAHFDPFLASQISKYANKEKGHIIIIVPYIWTIYIFDEWQSLRKYCEINANTQVFSIIVESTPDISKSNQLSSVLRYVLNRQPK